MRAYHVAVRGFNFKLITYQKVISAPFLVENDSAPEMFWFQNKGADMTF